MIHTKQEPYKMHVLIHDEAGDFAAVALGRPGAMAWGVARRGMDGEPWRCVRRQVATPVQAPMPVRETGALLAVEHHVLDGERWDGLG